MGDHSGHRQRMIEKMKNTVLSERELLEVLLFNALPRRNTGDLAHRLLSEFKTLYGVFTAPFARLCAVEGVGESVASYLASVGAVYFHVLGNYRADYPAYFQRETFLPFVLNKYRDLDCEVLDVYLIGRKGKITGFRRFASLDEKEVFVDVVSLISYLAKECPFGVVVAHNHPKGLAYPSGADDRFTAQLQAVCAAQNAQLIDHIVCSPNGAYSYAENGKMNCAWEGTDEK